MRVLFTTPYPVASASGVAVFVRQIADRLRANGKTPIVVEPSAHADASGLANARLALCAAKAVFRNRARIDIVHCQQLHPMTWAAGLVGRALGKSIVVTVHGRSPKLPGFRGLVFSAIESSGLRLPHRLLFVAETLRAEFGGRGAVIPNGVPVAEIRACAAAREAVREELGVGSAKVLLFLGRVTTDKGVPTLLDAVEELQSSCPDSCHVVLVGPVAEELRARLDYARSVIRVHAVGPRNDPWRFLAAADVFVLPSFREGLPFSLLEAMALGLPVVATEVGEVPRLVEHGSTGLLVPPGDPHALAGAIRQILDDPEGAARMGARAAERVEDRYGFEDVWKAYCSVYRDAAGRARDAPWAPVA